jgi:hypothetical protein
MGGRPVGIAGITVEYERAGFQLSLEFFKIERHGLVVVVRADNFEIDSVTHGPPAKLKTPVI